MNKFNIPIINPLNNNMLNNIIWHFDRKLVENPDKWQDEKGRKVDKCYSRVINNIKIVGILININYYE